MKRKTLLFLGILLAFNAISQTTLSAGDIAILQYNADFSPHEIKFLALTSMESGTTINFTDNGWTGSALKTDEGTDTWTASGNIKAGDIIDFTLTNISLGTGGDQIIAYQGSSGSPTFIFALNNEGSAVWQAGSPNTRESALPSGLTNGTNAVALTEKDNYRFKTVAANRKGKISLILSSICNSANWNGSNTKEKIFTQNIVSEIKWVSGSWTSDDSPTGTTDEYFLTNIRDDYTTSSDGTFNANELEIRSGRDLTISSGDNITIQNSITNAGNIILEDNASLVQVITDGPNTGTGYTVNRISTSQAEERNYTYWSSPLTSSTLAEVTAAAKYYSFTASTQTWVEETSSTTMTPGLGYTNTGNTSLTYPNTYTASFTGSAFNNGNISVTLGFTADADADTDWNLLGNPYPSAIDADTFIADNTNIGGTLYFWTHNTADSVGDNTQDDYVLWNGSGGTGSCGGCTAPDGNIASGQGFFAQALSTGSATFTNSMRVSGSNSLFYKGQKPKKEKNRIWLNLNSENGFSQTLIAFLKDATDGVDRIYDGLRLNGGGKVSFYSILEGQKFGIQGKSSLQKEEIIPIGFDASETGNFKIEIDHSEGALKKSKIVLVDEELGIEHNLKKPYLFTVNEVGTYMNRFKILINTKKKHLNQTSNKNLRVHLKKNHLMIASKKTLKEVKIYSIFGKLLYTKKLNGKKYRINIKNLSKRKLLVLKVRLKNGEIVRRKILNQ
jgi:hypothetical protein